MRLLLDKILAFFSFQADLPELTVARHRVLSKQIPIMYLIVIVNVLILSTFQLGKVPHYLTVLAPGVLVGISLARILAIYLHAETTVSIEKLRSYHRVTFVFSVFMGGAFIVWALLLFEAGDSQAKAQVVFFIGLTVLVVIVCLMPILQVAITIFAIVVVPASVFLAFQPEGVYRAMAVNMFLVIGALVAILWRSFADFRDNIERQVELDRINREIQKIANEDSLTGLANRRSLFDDLQVCINAKTQFVLVLIDLDGFKPVNDVFGHAVGDKVLQEIASRALKIIPKNAFMARLGGDEFAIRLAESTEQDAVKVVKGIFQVISEPSTMIEGSAVVSGTAGLAQYPNDGENVLELFENADFALYHAKQEARGGVVVFSSEHATSIRAASEISHLLRDANIEEEFFLEYQPIIESLTGQIRGFEALARWENPILGRVPPDVFVEAAERTGLIFTLTKELLIKAMNAAKDWPSDIYLSFNLSTMDICSRDQVSQILQLVRDAGFPPSRLVFEITETAVMKDFDRAISSLKRLKFSGFALALDDFGTGNSSLAYLLKLPIDRVKIDRAFTNEINEDQAASKIIAAVISLCESLKLTCIIEGVENKFQVAELQKLGCNKMQGYFFSDAISTDSIPDYVALSSRGLYAAGASYGTDGPE
ncbi:putative bifunctional diguanylate cyclase/phosphodiesterase [Roseibium aggregatum]|uniref:putative bifunctional diguanylate cyclase/phosphodiesterase n=1 Tax=Roseibium aggregatum TaxID=187304 RepID=UPI0025AB8A84|nr:EAL domain-containing protein [Roseibium aggregatum]WJS05766.1 EAL domain-containing protein [Roseibium aggregatum]